MFKLQLIICLVFITNIITAQSKQDYVWITGYDFAPEDGTQVMTGDFNSTEFDWELTDNTGKKSRPIRLTSRTL